MLPFIAAGMALVAGATATYTILKNLKKKEAKILLHGEIQAGKSTIITALTGKEYEGHTIQKQEVDISKYIKNDFKTLTITDVAGRNHKENEDVKEDFFKKDALKAFLYVFNAEDLKDEDFSKRENVQNDIKTYKDICQKVNVLFFVIGTRADVLGKERSKGIVEEIRRELRAEIFVINAKDKNEVLGTFNKIVKKLEEKQS